MAGSTVVGQGILQLRWALGQADIETVPPDGFCAIVATGKPLVVPDALADPRFLSLGLVHGSPGIRFYAGVPVRDSGGRVVGVLWCMDPAPHPEGVAPADLTALEDLAVLAAEALRQEAEAERLAEHVRMVIEAIPLPLMTIDSAGLITGWNPAAERVFGWTAAEAIGRFAPHVPPEDIGGAVAIQDRNRRGERQVGIEVERMRCDGTRLPVAVSTAPLRDAEGRPDGAVIVIEDISARRAAEAASIAHAARTERQAALLTRIATATPGTGKDLSSVMLEIAAAAAQDLEGCDAGVWLRDRSGELRLVTLVGPDGAPLPADAPKRRTLERVPVTPGLAAALLAERQIAAEAAATDPRVAELRASYIQPFGVGAMLSAAIRTGQEMLGVVSACRPGGPHGWNAEDRSFMASLADLAAVALEAGRRAEAMARLAEEKDRAEAASRAKSLFLGTLSHELRTPLNAIIGFSELLLSPGLPERQRLEFAGHVVAAGRHLLGVFNAMLDQARVEAGVLTLAEEPVALPRLLDEAAELMLAEAGTRGIVIHRAEDTLPPLRADGGRLRQAFVNLIANAVKFSPDSGRVELDTGFDPAAGFRIRIRDEGPGMATADLPRAFEPFRQLDEGLQRRTGGAGLGLPLAKSLIEAHGGTLSVETAPGRGTCVVIILPAARALPLDEKAAASAP